MMICERADHLLRARFRFFIERKRPTYSDEEVGAVWSQVLEALWLEETASGLVVEDDRHLACVVASFVRHRLRFADMKRGYHADRASLLGDFNRFVARQVDVSHPHDLHECLCHPGLSQAYQSLSHKYRGAIECIVFAGLTDGQAAEVLGIPRQTVKSRHARAVASLRKALQHA